MLSEAHDLRSGNPPWRAADYRLPPSGTLPAHSDIAIIGAGIMGATLAERLTADGFGVTLFDRRSPAHGSTAASTAHVMWAADMPLVELSANLGAEESWRRWRRVYRAVQGYSARIDDLGIACDKHARPTLYLAGDRLDEAGLQREADLHRRAGLPTRYLGAGATAERFEIAPRACLLSDGGFEVEPTKLTLGLLEAAVSRGAQLVYPCDVTAISPAAGGLRIELADGRASTARCAIFAGGYERAPLLLPPAFRLISAFAIATAPGTPELWREKAMIWEASDPYIYIRATSDGRIIAGGEDIAVADAEQRDRLMNGKSGTIAAKSAAILGEAAPLSVDCRWAAMFGTSPDGLPAIGAAANCPNLWLAAGFGGNGIAFAALAAELLASAMRDEGDPDLGCFNPYRFSE